LGDDDLARQCLARKYDVDRQTAELNEQLTRQRAYIDKLSSAAKALENRVKSLKMRENTLKTQARGGVSGRMNDAFSEFNRFEDRIEGQAAEVELDRTLDPGGRALEEETLRARLENLERSNAADTELAQLKQRAKREATQAPRPGAAQTPIGERPTNTDDELEKEMELIRQQLSTESAGLEDSLKELKQKLDDHDSES
jgi:phage shock protein A